MTDAPDNDSPEESTAEITEAAEEPADSTPVEEQPAEEIVEETQRAATDAREAVAAREFPAAEHDWEEPPGARAGAVARRVGPVLAVVALGWLLRQFVRRRRKKRG